MRRYPGPPSLRFVARFQDRGRAEIFGLKDGDGEYLCLTIQVRSKCPLNTDMRWARDKRFGPVQVLVGDSSRLLWVPCRARFELNSIKYTPVPGWDKKLDDVPETNYIKSGEHYVFAVLDGEDPHPGM